MWMLGLTLPYLPCYTYNMRPTLVSRGPAHIGLHLAGAGACEFDLFPAKHVGWSIGRDLSPAFVPFGFWLGVVLRGGLGHGEFGAH